MASFRPPITDTAGHRVSHLFSLPFTSVAASAANVRRRISVPVTSIWLSGAMLLGGLTAGILISMQWQEHTTLAASATASSPVTRQSDREIVASTIARLETDQTNLKKQIADLRTQLTEVQGTDADRKTTLQDLNNEISHQRLGSGTAAVQGPGIVATLDDSTDRSIPEDEDPANYILHEYDLRDVLNTLWIAGAEAVSINGERIVSNTSLYCVGTTIICNATRLSPPYEVHAIGDPQVLASALKGSPQMEKFNQRSQIYDLPVKIDIPNSVQVPAYNGSFVYKYATVQGQK